MTDTDIAVVGAGIAGASVAAHLSALGEHDITVYERGSLAGETTAKSAAYFGFYGSELERRLKRYGMATYNEFAADPRAAPAYELVGRMHVATTTDGADALRTRAAETPEVSFFDRDAVTRSLFLPELATDVTQGVHYRPHVGYLTPRELAMEFVERARERGVEFRTGTAVSALSVEDGAITGLIVDDDHVTADAVVCAAGPWNPQLLATAGIDLPVYHTLAPILRLDRTDQSAHTLPIISHHESGVYVRGDGPDSALVGHYPTDPEHTTFDPAAIDNTVPDSIRAEMDEMLEELLPVLADAPVAEEWVGIRSGTPDGHPIAGWTDVAGLSVAAFNSSGIQLSPAVGDVIARQLIDGEPTDVHDALSIGRFDGHDAQPFQLD
ncbi:MAG: FAD-dependent oxidoreductase [Halobacteriales archaeon]|nr:FAD-dependent oxidoreductase [Halobacteriales archaeon]